MSVLDVLALISQHPLYTVIYAAAIPVLTIVLRPMHGPYDAPLSPWKYFYSVLIYLSCIPGFAGLFFALYLSVFQRTNLLELSIVTYFLPVASMAVTLVIMRKSIRFDEIPGFRTLFGLFLLIVLSFVGLLLLDRLRVFLFFRGSFLSFVLIWVAIFIVLRIAVRMIFGRFRH
ncbi:hypothetical protein [Salinispira pacifica]